MDKINKPYFIIRKPLNLDEVKFLFVNNEINKIVFQSFMRDKKDFVSINLDTLDPHFNYSYYFSVRKNGEWTKVSKSKLIIPEFVDEETKIKYSFNKNSESNKMIVAFSSSASTNNIYNYYRTLKDIKCNKLFLADESFSEDKTQCSYFIGRNKENYYEKKIIHIIKKIASENNILKDNIILVGSSKGGFASLYYAFKYEFGSCIVGSPTIKLGEQHKRNAFGLKIIENLSGGITMEDIEWLDNIIVKYAINNDNIPNVYYHAGEKESRYLEQGIPFLNMLLEKSSEKIDIDLGPYMSHSEVKDYYPKYLIGVLNKII